MMNSKAIRHQEKRKHIHGGEPDGHTPFLSFPRACAVHQHERVRLCSHAHDCLCGCLCLFT